VGSHFNGGGYRGKIFDSLAVAYSLNSEDPLPVSKDYIDFGPIATGTYHSEFEVRRNVFVGFKYETGKMSGSIATNTFYIRPFEVAYSWMSDNTYVNSDLGWRYQRKTPGWALAGAMPVITGTDPLWYWVLEDKKFFTDGGNCSTDTLGPNNGSRCTEPSFGISTFTGLSEYKGSRPPQNGEPSGYPLLVDRLNPTTGAMQTPTSEYRWVVTSGDKVESFTYDNFRHFSVVKGGVYKVAFEDVESCPSEFPPAQFWDGCKGSLTVPWVRDIRTVKSFLQFTVNNLRQPDDYAIVAVPRPTGSGTLRVAFSTWANGNFTNKTYFQALAPVSAGNLAGALAELHDPNAHFKYYDDGSLVWIKLEQYTMKFEAPIAPDNWLLDTILTARVYFD